VQSTASNNHALPGEFTANNLQICALHDTYGLFKLDSYELEQGYHSLMAGSSLTPKGRMKSIFWSIFGVWAGYCGCNICPKISNFGEHVV
jgi:hypothetical protein